MRRAAAILCSVVLLWPGPARASHGGSHPDSTTQPVYDGCRRSTGEVLLGTTPEWTYVGADREPKTLEGVVAASGPAVEDNPTAHESYDLDFGVVPDPGYEGLLATANLGNGRIGVEWEEGAFPFWAWPTAGDHVTVLGSWIWDCGHWGSPSDPRQDPEAWIPYREYGPQYSGERTEIHPPRAVFTVRHDAAAPDGVVSRADLFISSDGTQARAQEECQLSVGLDPSTGMPNPASAIERATGVAGGCSAWQPVNDRDYDFTMPLPPGSGAVSAVVGIHEQSSAPAPSVIVDTGSGTATVHVPFAGFGEPLASATRPRMTLGATIELHRANPLPSVGARITITQVLVNVDLDTEDTTAQGYTTEPSEYNVYADVAGRWVPLHGANPGLMTARVNYGAGMDVVIEVWVPAGRPVRVFAAGRECDLPHVRPCRDVRELSFNENPGEVEATVTVPVTSRWYYSAVSNGCGCYRLDWWVDPV